MAAAGMATEAVAAGVAAAVGGAAAVVPDADVVYLKAICTIRQFVQHTPSRSSR